MKNNPYNVCVRSTNQKFNNQQFNCVAVAYKRNDSMNVIENSSGESNLAVLASYVMLTSGERFTNVGLSPLFL